MNSLDPNGHGSSTPMCRLKACGHIFHIPCLQNALKTDVRCPTCRCFLTKPQGHSPSGFMTIDRSSKICDGRYSSIVIRYSMAGGIQKAYHENPGQRFSAATRVAYLPDSPQGNQLLDRLIFAFSHGLTFRVGSSLTSGKSNCITWASIHHKTQICGGVHGFPDPLYFDNCNKELDNLGVPK